MIPSRIPVTLLHSYRTRTHDVAPYYNQPIPKVSQADRKVVSWWTNRGSLGHNCSLLSRLQVFSKEL